MLSKVIWKNWQVMSVLAIRKERRDDRQGLFILSSFPRRRESMWSCHEKIAIGHGHVGSRFRGKDETRLTQSGK